MNNIDTDAMVEGVQHSAIFVLFMTKGVFKRPYVRLEIEEAFNSRKPILLVHEDDKRHEPFDFSAKEKKPVTHEEAVKDYGFTKTFRYSDKEYQEKLDEQIFSIESIKWQRRTHLQEAVINKIKQRFYQQLGRQQLVRLGLKTRIKDAFDEADTDKNNSIDEKELRKLIKSLGEKLNKGQVHKIFTSIDRDKSGKIDWEGFEKWWDRQNKVLVRAAATRTRNKQKNY